MEWTDWSMHRFLVLFVSIAFLLMGIQVTLFHYRQNFHHKVMWLPVVASPIFFVCGVLLALVGTGWLRNTFIFLMAVGAVAGLYGFARHLKGVGQRIGGYELRNFLIGPPVILPLMFSALSVLGLTAIYWR